LVAMTKLSHRLSQGPRLRFMVDISNGIIRYALIGQRADQVVGLGAWVIPRLRRRLWNKDSEDSSSAIKVGAKTSEKRFV
jgi:hypothetical protein